MQYHLAPAMMWSSQGTARTEESGISYFHRSPYLNLRGSGVMIGAIDTGIDYRHQAFTYEDRTTKIYSIWDSTIRDLSPGYETWH